MTLTVQRPADALAAVATPSPEPGAQRRSRARQPSLTAILFFGQHPCKAVSRRALAGLWLGIPARRWS